MRLLAAKSMGLLKEDECFLSNSRLTRTHCLRVFVGSEVLTYPSVRKALRTERNKFVIGINVCDGV